jgi:hypothetical protein
MSQRTPAPGPSSSAPRRASESLPALSPSLSRPQSSHNAPQGSPYLSVPQGVLPRGTLPPLGSIAPANTLPPLLTDPRPTRSLGVHSILNPSYHESQERQKPEATASLESPQSPTLSAGDALPRISKRLARASPTAEDTQAAKSRTERRILTPKSPRMRAASSVGRQTHALGPFGTSNSPTMRVEGRMYTAEPGSSNTSEIPPLPYPNPLGRSSMPYPPFSEPALGQPRGLPTGRGPLAVAAAQAQGESPRTSHSSHSHFSQSSPILRHGPPASNPPSLSQTSGRQPVNIPPGQSHAGLTEGQYDMSKGSYGISIPTEGGEMILPVELDVEQASKMANEKRLRNAGASARFRQRRKEKEREAAQTISSLERDLRALEEERNHYRSERDYFRDLYARQTGPGQLPQRPLTPRAQTAPRPSLGDNTPQWQDLPRDTTEGMSRNLRRRTSSYPSTLPAPPTAPSMLPPQPQPYGFGPQAPAPILSNPFPPTRAPGTPQFPQLPPSPRISTPQDLFHRDPFSRSWNPGP